MRIHADIADNVIQTPIFKDYLVGEVLFKYGRVVNLIPSPLYIFLELIYIEAEMMWSLLFHPYQYM